ncbi:MULTISPECIES: aspartyl protease family protein [unclassified Sphingobacterium]|uniref:aspartyl protease family protein n=1 Tax=unclassified Sphingobacterium TaxID=2609468 RepID=UPI0025E192A0|nr:MULTISPECIES: aspartyl protease family protein [unclassified Sphingobacterium]
MKKNSILTILIAFFATPSFAQEKPVSDTLMLAINEQNTISVKGIFNEKDTLNLNFDTGTTELVLTNNTIATKLKSKINLYNTAYPLLLGQNLYRTKVYDAQLSGHGTDGRFGWDLFKGKAVELNYDKGLMVVHNQLPLNVGKDKSYSKHTIVFYKELFFMETQIRQSGVTVTDTILFDTGYQRTLMLNSDLLTAQKFPYKKMKEIKRVLMKGAQGNEIPVVTANLSTLKIGRHSLKNIPAQIANANKPFKEKDIHVLGNEVLKRFNVFLDFQDNNIYLQPNKYYNLAYIEAK